MSKYFSIQTAVTMIIVLVLFYIIMYWMGSSKKTSDSPSAEAIKSKAECEKYGYKWDAEKNACTKI